MPGRVPLSAEEARRAFDDAPLATAWGATRLKDVRDRTLSPGGRVALTLFERAEGGDRPHPRLRTDLPPFPDPDAEPLLGPPPESAPTDAATFGAWVRSAWAAAAPRVQAPPAAPPPGSPRFAANSLRAQRTARFLDEAGAALDGWLREGLLPPDQADACRLALAVFADEAWATEVGIEFDDADTGTYHSFGHDKPFVHYLERILASLPAEDTPAFSVHDGFQQAALRRQREQATAHLDHLMRHKYAHDHIVETDIEPGLGGFLIDRSTRRVVSEDPASADSLQPAYQLLRVDPAADHPHAGAWVYRDGQGGLRLDESGETVAVAAALLRASPVDAADLSFRRAPGDPGLRRGVRFDWNGDGYVQPEPIGWIGWAGHCDIKAIMESLGLVLRDGESVTEYRSDTGATTTYDRDLLVEMVASAMELGSLYARADGSGMVQRGIHRFGGARNDSRPDRLQFQGFGPGKSFRWPLSGRQDSFRVTRITEDLPADTRVEGGPTTRDLDLDLCFFEHLPDPAVPAFAPNPRYLQTVEGDYNLIDVSDAVVEVRLQEDGFDAETGYPTSTVTTTRLDLRPLPADTPADAPDRRCYLGTHIKDPRRRELYKVWLDRAHHRIEARVLRWERADGRWAPVEVAGEDVEIPLVSPLRVTLSRELRRDDPAAFRALLDQALRHGQNICADTDMRAEVWNGVVTRIHAEKVRESAETRTEHWRVAIRARFGSATLEYLVRRAADGTPEAWCPALGEEAFGRAPDFLWQDLPDVGTKGVVDGAWVINSSMLERNLVHVRPRPAAPGGFYVDDEHIKNVYELVFAGLGALPWTIVHGNKRFGFAEEAAWRRAVDALEVLRQPLLVRGLDGSAVPLVPPVAAV